MPHPQPSEVQVPQGRMGELLLTFLKMNDVCPKHVHVLMFSEHVTAYGKSSLQM